MIQAEKLANNFWIALKGNPAATTKDDVMQKLASHFAILYLLIMLTEGELAAVLTPAPASPYL